MEQDIKILEEFITENNDWKCIECGFNCKKEAQAIENLINRNKELEEDYTSVYLKGVYDERDKWKSKIKEKIKELDKEEKRELKGTKGQDRYYIKQKYMYKRNTLQELLEE